MEWKTDGDMDDMEDQPDTMLKQGSSGGLMGRNPVPYIFMGIGLFVLILVFVFFIPRPPPDSTSRDAALVQQVDSMEQRIQILEQYIKELKDSGGRQWMDPKNSVEYQQLVNWIKSNAEMITEVNKRMDVLERRINPARTVSAGTAGRAPDAARKTEAIPLKTVKSETIKPGGGAAVQQPAESQQVAYHEVRKGETLYGIARTYGISVNALKELNHLKDNIIQVGQKLVIKRK